LIISAVSALSEKSTIAKSFIVTYSQIYEFIVADENYSQTIIRAWICGNSEMKLFHGARRAMELTIGFGTFAQSVVGCCEENSHLQLGIVALCNCLDQ
jgi:hypothetical protein